MTQRLPLFVASALLVAVVVAFLLARSLINPRRL